MVLDFKTELVATINRAKGSPCSVNFKPSIEYFKKKGKTNTITFVKDEPMLAKLGAKEPTFKKNVIYCLSGLPASSAPTKVRRNPKTQPTQPRAPVPAATSAPRPKQAASKKPSPVGPPGGAVRGGPPQTAVAKKPATANNAGPGRTLPQPSAAPGSKPMGGKPMPMGIKKAAPPQQGGPMGAKPMAKPTPAAGAKSAAGPPRALPKAAPAAKLQFRALYDYDAVEVDELTFREGDIISLTKKVDPEWWEGQLNGKIGMFPANYVEEIRR